MAIQKSLVRRYLLLSLLASVLPVLTVGLLYDRFAESSLQTVIDEKLSAHLTATASRIAAFVEARRYQAETLASYPGILPFATDARAQASEQVNALLQVESDLPDLFGILFFSASGRITHVVPGQAASGPPYWREAPLRVEGLPVTAVGEMELVGPSAPADGQAGWLLLRAPLREARREGGAQDSVALHVRLASLTELMGADPAAGALEPVLKTPAGYFNRVGQKVTPVGKMVAGPEIYPGWQPMLQVEASQLLEPFDKARRALFVAVLVGAVLIVILFYRLSKRLRQRVGQLREGAAAISSGRLDYRIREHGDDEVAAVARAFDAMAARLEEHLAQQVRMEKMAVLGEFATGIAHEVRNPLAAVKTSVQALARRESDERRLALLTDVASEIDRLARVVSQLLDFGRPRAPAPTAVKVEELFRRALLLLSPEARAREIILSVHGDQGLLLWADADHVVQILLNLGINALQASPAGEVVALHAAQRGGFALLSVEDHGHGIAAEELARVTDPFFTTRSKGMGLGLSISRQLAEMNGGGLEIRSTPGAGTTVLVSFPLSPPLLENSDGQHPDH